MKIFRGMGSSFIFVYSLQIWGTYLFLRLNCLDSLLLGNLLRVITGGRFGLREILLAPFLRLRNLNWCLVSGEIDDIIASLWVFKSFFSYFWWDALPDFIREDFFRDKYGVPNYRFP